MGDVFVIPVDAPHSKFAEDVIAQCSFEEAYEFSVEDLNGFAEAGTNLDRDYGNARAQDGAHLFMPLKISL